MRCGCTFSTPLAFFFLSFLLSWTQVAPLSADNWGCTFTRQGPDPTCWNIQHLYTLITSDAQVQSVLPFFIFFPPYRHFGPELKTVSPQPVCCKVTWILLKSISEDLGDDREKVLLWIQMHKVKKKQTSLRRSGAKTVCREFHCSPVDTIRGRHLMSVGANSKLLHSLLKSNKSKLQGLTEAKGNIFPNCG